MMRHHLYAAALTAAFCLSTIPAALADDVTVSARNGALSVSGTLLSYDGETYRLRSQWGDLTIEASAVECSGPGCPDLRRFAPTLKIALEPWLIDSLLAPRLSLYARAQGLTLERPETHKFALINGAKPLLYVTTLPLNGAPQPLLAAGEADVAMGHADTSSQSARLLARIPLRVVTSHDAPAGALPHATLAANPRNWSGLGITADQPLIWHHLAQGGLLDRAITARFGAAPQSARSAATTEQLIAGLRADPWGISLLPALDPVPEGLTARTLVSGCDLTLDQSEFATALGTHPLSLPITLLEAPHKLPAPARALLETLSQSGRPELDLTLRRSLSQQPTRLQNAILALNDETALSDLRQAIATLATSAQLPIQFHPRADGTFAPEADDIARLAALIEAGSFKGESLLLVGFTDSRGTAKENEKTALARAEALRAALIKAAPDAPQGTEMIALGFGEIMPVACNSSAQSREANRRIEVWVRPRPS